VLIPSYASQSCSFCSADDGYGEQVVENAKYEKVEDSGKLQSAVWMGRSFGSIFASAFSGIALQYWKVGTSVDIGTPFDTK
jgi:hypothetical protein